MWIISLFTLNGIDDILSLLPIFIYSLWLQNSFEEPEEGQSILFISLLLLIFNFYCLFDP